MDPKTRKDRERLERENVMVAAAKEVFCQKGFEATSMDEISKKAEFTKRTLYQYFASKEELFFAVVGQGFQKLFTAILEATEKDSSGYDRMASACQAYYLFFKAEPEFFAMFGYWGHVKRKAVEKGPKCLELEGLNAQLFQIVAKFINQGKLDGSLKPKLEAQRAALSTVFLMTGFFNQLAATGKTFTSHFEVDMNAFAAETIEMLLSTLRDGSCSEKENC